MKYVISAVLSLGLFTQASQAVIEKTESVKKNAFFKANEDNGLYEPLNLKRKTFVFKKADIDACGQKMIRVKDTLHYTCTMNLPNAFRSSKRENQITPVVMMIPYGGTDRRVFVTVNDDVSQVSYSTEFDMTGFDLEIAKFNDDFYRIYGKAAVNIIGDAMAKTLQVETVDSRERKTAQRN